MSNTPATQPDEQIEPENVPATQPDEEDITPEAANATASQAKEQAMPEKRSRLRAKFLPPYKVILFNDDHNEMDFVVAVLLRLVNHMSQSKAVKIMLTAHLTGSAVVIICPKESAEYYQERFLSYGLKTTIEPD